MQAKEVRYIITIIVLLGTILLITYPVRKDTDTSIEEYKLQHQVDSLNAVIVQHRHDRNEYLLDIEKYQKSIDSLQSRVDSSKRVINKIKKERNEAMEHIAKFNVNDITNFFSERYGN
jgi:peptidoglycan hydrolase CwlO-like protein